MVKQFARQQTESVAGEHVLDLGCGTGTLALMVKRAQPGATVVGLDADPAILKRARRKADAAGLEIQLDRGLSNELPYADAYFDVVISSLSSATTSPPRKSAPPAPRSPAC